MLNLRIDTKQIVHTCPGRTLALGASARGCGSAGVRRLAYFALGISFLEKAMVPKAAPLANSFILCYCYPKNKPRMTPPERTVLIIEDEADAAELFAEMMRVSGFRVLKTSSSIPAIAMMTAEKPDIILLDIMMPDVSGLDILRQMRRDPVLANIPVVVVTAKSMPADIKNGMEAGASTYLTKPVGFLELKEAVEHALGGQSTAI